MAEKYRIWYFDGKRGRAEQIRLILKYSKIPFEDVVGAAAAFGDKKSSGDLAYGSYPMLEECTSRLKLVQVFIFLMKLKV